MFDDRGNQVHNLTEYQFWVNTSDIWRKQRYKFGCTLAAAPEHTVYGPEFTAEIDVDCTRTERYIGKEGPL